MVQLLGKAVLQMFFMDGRTWVLMCAVENDESRLLGTITRDSSFFSALVFAETRALL